MQHHCRLKCASQSGIMLMVELPSGHQTVSTLMELFMADLGSQCVGSRMEHVNSGKHSVTLLAMLSLIMNELNSNIFIHLLINLTLQF